MMRILFALFLASALFSLGCEETSAPAEESTTESETVYECPMHCVPEGATEEYTSNEPGECPVCGMDLVER